MLRVLVQQFHDLLRAVAGEFAAEHVDVGPESMKRVAATVHGGEAVPGLHPVDKPLLVRQREVARGVREDHRVIILQVVQGKLRHRGRHRRSPAGQEHLVFRLVGREFFQVGLGI